MIGRNGTKPMVNRWIGIVCLIFMLSANTALFVRDILPGWLAGDPPQLEDLSREASFERRAQIGVFSEDDRNIGRSWTISGVQGEFLDVSSTTMLYPNLLRHGLPTPQVRIDTTLKYRREDGLLGELLMTMRGLPAVVQLQGGFVPPDEFACKWKLGALERGRFRLDAQATRAMGDVLRPFDRLPGLYVGRTWRLQLLDPLSQVVPGLQSDGMFAEPQLVRVTRTETIRHHDGPVEAFVVEARRVRAWVAPDGQVLRQEIELPLLGKLTLVDEPFDKAAYERARRWSPQNPPE